MKVNKVKLTSFRNYQKEEISFERGINLIYGSNASGKTNLVESIALLSLGKSFRTNEEENLINKESSFAKVEIELEKNKKIDLQMIISKNGKKIYCNEIPLEKFSELSGILIAITFIPEDVFLFKDSPNVRRRSIDICLANLYRRYIYYLSEYKSYLKQRNALLKEENISLDLLKIFEEKMIENQYHIVIQRNELFKGLENKINLIFKKISLKEDSIKIKYQTDFLINSNYEEFKKDALKKYEENRENDLRRKSSSIGIHKDDFIVYLNEKDISLFGSQGQNRLVSLSLKLAYGELVKEVINDDPVLILDDVLSELDETHQTSLINALLDYEQVFITSAMKEENKNIKSLYQVDNGVVIRRK